MVWLDEERESLRYLQTDSPRDHGTHWYDCDEGFGFDGDILGGFLPKGEPIATPPGSAVEMPGDALVVYKLHYHAHYDHVDPDDTDPLPDDPSDVAATAHLVTFGNDNDPVVDGTGNLTAPFGIPAGSSQNQGHVETMVTKVPGTTDDAYAVFAIQPEMKHSGRRVSISVGNQESSSEECLAANPRWDQSWMVPMTFDTTTQDAPVIYGGDRLRVDCEYLNMAGSPMTLEHESCRAMVGLVPLD